MVASAATGACAILVAVLIASDAAGARRAEVASKIAASASFVAVAIAHAASGYATAYTALVVIGLCFAAAGDAALAARTRRGLVAGLGLFTLTHVALVTAVASIVPPATWITPAAAVPVAAALVALAWLSPHVGALRTPVAFYVATLTTTVIAALAAALAAPVPGLGAAGAYLLAGGAGLFFASDLAVAKNHFVAPDRRVRSLGRVAYYAGQLGIAHSVAFAAPA